jgi:hypothetical protein
MSRIGAMIIEASAKVRLPTLRELSGNRLRLPPIGSSQASVTILGHLLTSALPVVPVLRSLL